jgi:hypothetical protein
MCVLPILSASVSRVRCLRALGNEHEPIVTEREPEVRLIVTESEPKMVSFASRGVSVGEPLHVLLIVTRTLNNTSCDKALQTGIPWQTAC